MLSVANSNGRWPVATIGDVCGPSQYGWTTKARNAAPGLRLLRTTDISRGVVDWGAVPACEVEPPDPEKYLLRDGDVLIARAGSIGISYLVADPPPAVFASYLIRFRPTNVVLPRYLAWFLQSPGYWAQVRSKAGGIALQNVNAKQLGTVQLPVPPLAEQHALVAGIEGLMSRLDESRRILSRVGGRLRSYNSSVLRLAVDEGDALWRSVTLPEVTVNRDGRRVPVRRADRAVRSGPYPYYGASGIIDHVDGYLFEGTYLLVAEDGANLLSRSTPIAFRASGKFWVNNHAHVLEPKAGVDIRFLESALNGLDLRPFVTGTAQPKLTQGALNRLLLRLPPEPTQVLVADEIDRQLSLADGVGKAATSAEARAKALRGAILAAFFSGRSVGAGVRT
jgi:type I restriction enzyme S subunit